MGTSHQTDINLYCGHFLVLFFGTVVGIAAAYWIALLPLAFGNDLATARTLGIVSLTTLEGYSKTRDIVNYTTLISLPPCFAMLSWHLWSRGERYDRLCRAAELPEAPGNAPSRLQLLVVFTAIILVSFNINYFFRPIVDWVFPLEEGINLFAVSSIFRGGVQSLDFTSWYGPMLIYPLALLMKLVGYTILTDRIYTYLLNVIAYGIVTLFFYRTIRSSTLFVVASLLYFSVFHPFVAVSPNSTYLRVALGFLPLLFVRHYWETKSRCHLWLSGLIAGQSLLFSQEVGFCSLIALTTVLFLNNLPTRSFRAFIIEIRHVGSALLASIAPVLIYFAGKGALPTFVFELTHYPKLYSLGYGAIPFPSLPSLFTGQISIQALFPYWLIAIYLLSALWLLPQLFLCKPGQRTLIPLSIFLLGVLLFRSALCRSDFYHFFFVAQPAFILFFLILDQALGRARSSNHHQKPCLFIVIALFAAMYSLPYLSSQYREATINDVIRQGFDMEGKFALHRNEQQRVMKRTGGVPVGEDLRESVANIDSFLERNTTSNEYVYFYPIQAGYYFLFNRKNPTRYAYSYQAITSGQRHEIINDLETKKPRFVIFSRQAWVMDNIPPNVQVPELHEYLLTKYSRYEDLGNIRVMKRIGL